MMLNYVSPGPAPRTTHVRDGCYGLAWGYQAVSVLAALGPARRFHNQADAALPMCGSPGTSELLEADRPCCGEQRER
jgi:hypothetical protein